MASHLIFYWNAFWELSADRPVGMSMGRIPFTSIDRFARRYGIQDLDDFDRFRTLIRGMDSALREAVSVSGGKTVDPQDADGVRSLLQRLAKKESA